MKNVSRKMKWLGILLLLLLAWCGRDGARASVIIQPSGGATANQNIRQMGATFSNGGAALSGSTTICGYLGYSGTITQVTLAADQSGGATVDVQTVAFGSYTGPASASSITDAHTPALSAAVTFKDTTLTGWTTSLSADTMVCFALTAPSTITQLVATLKITAN